MAIAGLPNEKMAGKKSRFHPLVWYKKIKAIGHQDDMDEYERRKLSVFNQVNFLGIVAGLAISISGVFDNQHLPELASWVAISPVFISLAVILLNYFHRHELSRMVYFTLYPLITSLVYGAGLDLGLEIFFILYAVLAVFYLSKPVNAVFSFALSAGCYMAMYVFAGNYFYVLRSVFFPFYVFIHVLALVLIFFALYWLKLENWGYQQSILAKNRELHDINREIEAQKMEISKKADELADLNVLKNKLFSVVSHDLKGPIYAQRNLFQTMVRYDLPGDEIKELVPEILKDMNHTIGLMDNLLLWARSQMRSETILKESVEPQKLVESIVKVLEPQARAKQVGLSSKIESQASVLADKDMLDIVMRNLISNAIKFTSESQNVEVTLEQQGDAMKISIRDNGIGMTEETLDKISENNFFSSKGTHNESGTGLGLMLCKEFLKKNGSSLQISSRFGEGSTFSFELPLVTEEKLVRP
ncbi:MAG: ATP-binding protein [Bacteroidota bacterium]|nr:ATP-binding protein [Bacteroidota bacterium]